MLLLLVIVLLPTAHCSDKWEVLRISNVSFPQSSADPAKLNGTFHTGLTEFTVCLRFLIESYNEGGFSPFGASGDAPRGGSTLYLWLGFEDLSNGLGWGTRGFQGGVNTFLRGIPEGGRINKRFPIIHHFNNAINIETSTWNHMCVSYSSKLNILHLFQNGLKVFSYQYKDPQDIPLPANTFENTKLGINMRGLISDVNIFSTFFDEDSTKSLTLSCGEKQGDIFKWDARKVNITQDSDSQLDVTIETMDKSDICGQKDKMLTAQDPSKSTRMSNKKRYKQPQNSVHHLLIMFLKLLLILLRSQTLKQWIDACDSTERS